jgi:hypothetical protein
MDADNMPKNFKEVGRPASSGAGLRGVANSPRRKSSIAERFPRMQRIRDDTPRHEANTLQDLRLLLNM